MLHIGFTKEFYTLWNVTSEHIYSTIETARGPQSYISGTKVYYNFIQNLSKSKDEAISKAASMGCTDLQPDEDLYGRGRSQFGDSFEVVIPVLHWTLFEIPVYNMQGKDIQSFDYSETFQKRTVYQGETNYQTKFPGVSALWVEYFRVKDNKKGETITFNMKRRAVLCRQILVKLGKLVKFNGEFVSPKVIAIENKKSLLSSLVKGHHFENGKRIDLEIKLIETFQFSGYMDRTTWVQTYASKCGRLFKYMGSNPPEISKEEYVTVKATIKHDTYKGEPESKLQRISMK